MANFTPVPNGNNPNESSMVVITGNSSSANVVDFKLSNTVQTADNDARISADGLTGGGITQTGTVSTVVDCDGSVGFTISGTTLVAGDVFYVDSAGEPWDGGYQVISVSGSVYCTQVPYSSCYGTASTSGVVNEPVGSFGTYGGSILTFGDWCAHPLAVISLDKRVSQGYTNRLYTDCWECFTGVVDKCDITTTTVVLWDDDGVNSNNVVYADGNKVLMNDSAAPGSDNPVGQNKP